VIFDNLQRQRERIGYASIAETSRPYADQKADQPLTDVDIFFEQADQPCLGLAYGLHALDEGSEVKGAYL